MKNIFCKVILVMFLCASFAQHVAAREYIGTKTVNKSTIATKATSRCKRAQSTAELNINNVRASINAYGNMWFDGSITKYYIPANGTSTPMYCAALWIGGTDANDQLRLAALRFGSEGDDYWPGPLTVDGQASVSLETCNAYDKHYKITQSEVQIFRSMFDYEYDDQGSIVSVTQNSNYNPDAISDVIKNWPAHGQTSKNQSKYLAPFCDVNGDGEYDYTQGDYPYYDFDNKLCPKTLKANLNRGEKYEPAHTLEETYGTGGSSTIKGSILSDQVLKGDQTIWWVFNDMGNSHTESKGAAIGLEIRAQAFAFSTNDEINNMTFYSYEIINRSTYILKNTYFSQWVDPDLGYAHDDYVGCDVKRGLGYCYNGKDIDGAGTAECYKGNPPAIGIDFFQGPYMDADGKDNPKIDIERAKNSDRYRSLIANYWIDSLGCYDTIQLSEDADLFYDDKTGGVWYFVPGDVIGNCAINGVNFGNGITDDERFGMRRFVYYQNSSNAIDGEPSKAMDYYNYLRGYWKNNTRMKYGGNGSSGSGVTEFGCDFMFPGNSDPWNWGTDGNIVDEWTEKTAGNQPGDRRFMQSAGPFTLKPGALNYITVGIPFAQAASGGPAASVALLREIDDKCQALFENCFKIIDGPDAPTLVVQELKNEVILYLTYDNENSNNYKEKYNELDPSIAKFYSEVVKDTVRDAGGNILIDANGDAVTRDKYVQQSYTNAQRSYKFEGYQIYQLRDATVSIADIGDETKARLVAQCDVENYYDTTKTLPIGKLVNYEMNGTIGALVPSVKVSGANAGIKHSFRITKDAFAKGNNTTLINQKEYYFIAVAYAHNSYKEYDPSNATKLDGQKEPYLAGRKNEKQGSIEAVKAIPHDPSSENGGTVIQATYGMSPYITRIEGFGNGGNVLRLTKESIEELMGAPGVSGKPAGTLGSNGNMSNPCILAHPRYEKNYGPVTIRVVDPLSVKAGEFYIKFNGIDSAAMWTMSRVDGQPIYDNVYSIESEQAIGRYNEQLFLDFGISICISNAKAVASDFVVGASGVMGGYVKSGSFLSASMSASTPWLSGVSDDDNYMQYNWIRSGSQFAEGNRSSFLNSDEDVVLSQGGYLDEDYYKSTIDDAGRVITYAIDKDETFEKVLPLSSSGKGSWAPYGLCSSLNYHPAFSFRYYMADYSKFTYDKDGNSAGPSSGYNRYKTSYNKVFRSFYDQSTNKSLVYNDLTKLSSVRVVITKDKSKWTRCPVIEMCDDYTLAEGNARRFQMRKHASVGKNGQPDGTGEGMGWFPGYAINVETGERLNMMFGEDSRYTQHNGNDMLWNPTSTILEGSSDYVMGGRHYIYVLGANKQVFKNLNVDNNTLTYYNTPSYDEGVWAAKMLASLDRLMSTVDKIASGLDEGLLYSEANKPVLAVRDSVALLYASIMWVNMPLVASTYQFKSYDKIPCDVTIDLNVTKPYTQYYSANNTSPSQCGLTVQNANNPMYLFEITSDIVTLTNQSSSNENLKNSILDNISVIPNPYYSSSAYETSSQLDTRVRVANLPANSIVSIYTVDGTLVRRLGPSPSDAGNADQGYTLDWDLKTHTGLPISGGMYLIHVKTPMGERIIKWFGTMRPVDLNSFQFN